MRDHLTVFLCPHEGGEAYGTLCIHCFEKDTPCSAGARDRAGQVAAHFQGMIFIRHDRIKRSDVLYNYTEKYALRKSPPRSLSRQRNLPVRKEVK